MKRYIRATVCFVYSFIKFCLIKLFHFNSFRFSALNLVSPFTEIDIGKNATLTLGKMVRMRSGTKVRVRDNATVMLGDNASLNHGCMVVCHETIIIGKDVQFGPNVMVYDHDHDFKKEDGLKNLDYVTGPVEIGDSTWIGANVVILRGVKTGRNCVIAAGTILSPHKTLACYPDNSLIYQTRDTIVRAIVRQKR